MGPDRDPDYTLLVVWPLFQGSGPWIWPISQGLRPGYGPRWEGGSGPGFWPFVEVRALSPIENGIILQLLANRNCDLAPNSMSRCGQFSYFSWPNHWPRLIGVELSYMDQ